jgi:hypothetical protein
MIRMRSAIQSLWVDSGGPRYVWGKEEAAHLKEVAMDMAEFSPVLIGTKALLYMEVDIEPSGG